MTTTPDRDLAAACVRAWLHSPGRVHLRPRTRVVRYRLAAELRASGLTYRQIAEVMGCPQRSVENYLSRARRKSAREARP
jgi:hypothetical protein